VFVPMRVGLHEEPQVICIARRLSADVDLVVGKLHRLWGWCRRYLTDGFVRGLDASFVDGYVGLCGFAAALESVGWLQATELGLTFAGDESARDRLRRQRAAERQRRKRERDRQRDMRDITRDVTGDGGVTSRVTAPVAHEPSETDPAQANNVEKTPSERDAGVTSRSASLLGGEEASSPPSEGELEGGGVTTSRVTLHWITDDQLRDPAAVRAIHARARADGVLTDEDTLDRVAALAAECLRTGKRPGALFRKRLLNRWWASPAPSVQLKKAPSSGLQRAGPAHGDEVGEPMTPEDRSAAIDAIRARLRGRCG